MFSLGAWGFKGPQQQTETNSHGAGQTVDQWMNNPLSLLALPDDTHPAQAYPQFMLRGTLPPGTPQFVLNVWNRANNLAAPITSLFGRRQGSVPGP